MAGVRCAGRGRKTWGKCVKRDMKLLVLQAYSLNGQYSGIYGGTSYIGQMPSIQTILITSHKH